MTIQREYAYVNRNEQKDDITRRLLVLKEKFGGGGSGHHLRAIGQVDTKRTCLVVIARNKDHRLRPGFQSR